MDSGRKRIGRKLLVASLGVATVSFVACGKSKPLITDAATDHGPKVDTGANDGAMADASEPTDGATDSPFMPSDAGGAHDAGTDRQFIGNLI
jgi:hypothetical protein